MKRVLQSYFLYLIVSLFLWLSNKEREKKKKRKKPPTNGKKNQNTSDLAA